MVARTDEEWRALWGLHAGPDREPPAVDFDTQIVAGAFAGLKPTAGYRVQIAEAGDDGVGLRLRVSEEAPVPGTAVAAIVTYPFHIVALPRGSGEVAWTGASTNAQRPTATNRSASSHPTAPTSTSLSPRAASALAYAAGPVSGALMLLAESNDTVRFHAWQSIVALGGLALALLASYGLAFAALFVSTSAIAAMIDVATVVWIVFAIVWLICLWKASSGERWKLPLAGDLAERLTSPRTS